MGHADDRMTRYYDIADVERMRAVPTRILAHVRTEEKKVRKLAKSAGVIDIGSGRKAS